MRILVVDNYDSFVFNLVQYLGQLGTRAVVWRNDDPNLTGPDAVAAAAAEFDGILLSPGPGTPQRAGATMDLVAACAAAETPLLGVCLGHQAIAEAFGAVVTNADELMHGKTSRITHDDSAFYDGVPQPFTATRYHSLAVVDGTMPSELVITSRTQGGVIMGLRHESAPIYGVQFHPESVLTEGGYRMLGNWLAVAGLPEARERAVHLNPLVRTT